MEEMILLNSLLNAVLDSVFIPFKIRSLLYSQSDRLDRSTIDKETKPKMSSVSYSFAITSTSTWKKWFLQWLISFSSKFVRLIYSF